MLRHIDPTSLRAIQLEYTSSGALFLQEVEALCHTNRERCSPSPLRAITISAYSMDMAEGQLTMTTIKPLLAFGNLKVLDIYTYCNVGFGLDNASVELFVPAWPHMRRLEFNLRHNRDYNITLDGLIPIAR